MKFEVRWSERARKNLHGLPVTVAARILGKVARASEDPVRFFVQLRGERAWTLRVGDYRVIARVDLRLRRVEVIALGHRRNVYDR